MNRMRLGRVGALLLVPILVAGLCGSLLSSWTVPAAAAEGRAPYQFSIDSVLGEGGYGSGTILSVSRDVHLPYLQPLTVKGWVATAEGISSYEYLWVSAGGDTAAWQTVEDAVITSRHDLTQAGIPYTTGHSTAGFSLTVQPPDGTAEGYYDVYIRAIDGMGNACDLLALMDLRYGEPDTDDGRSYTVSFTRLLREGQSALVGDTTVTESGITLSSDARVRLGTFNLAAFACIRISYATSAAGVHVAGGRTPILGLKSAGEYGYGKAGESYNMTNDLAYAAVSPARGGGTVEIDLTDCDYRGEVWLSGYLGDTLTVTAVELVYSGYAADRVAAKINLSGDVIADYLTGYNKVTAFGVTDPLMGDVLRIELTEDTNDPFVHFNAGKLLSDYDIVLDASEYKYMVLLARSLPENAHKSMTFYLCAGSIMSATEACTHTFTVQNDGQWRYYLIDLSATANWEGIINGWRFDILNGDEKAGNAVELASVQLFRTEKAATAALRDPSDRDPYRSGDPIVIRDMCEETENTDAVFQIDPTDTYIVTEAVTEPTPEPTTGADADADPSDDDPTPSTVETTDETVSAEDGSADTDPAASTGGCASSASILAVTLAALGAMVYPAVRRKRE